MDLFKLLGRIIGNLLKGTWRILPFALMLAWEIIRVMIVTLIANFRGWRSTANDMADEWTNQLIKKGLFPINADKYLRPVFLTVAYLTIVAGWLLLSFATVSIVKWIF